ncbi:TMV resistance protein N-like isoform X3 [Rhododendron vialii]|uniref:TMV resistance protein N-like isoform X3 n=1 Tax=Rhododendron vialii TaxID=182163 RepID=UPI00265FCBBA|nr:TMV resistance protein N-like isoform X3 [Rhododendron vialii]
MAAPRTHEASTSTSRHAYQVFLSFRGKDLRKTFIDHLHTSLTQAGIHTFKDDDEIETGQDIESELQKAISQSKISLVVFSKGYASSTWCLDELVKIAERRRVCGQVVLPVFYDVDPSHVRKQSGAFLQAFGRHEEEAGTDEKKERVKRWREALTEVANLGGKVLENEADGHESKFIQEIVKQISSKLNRTVLNVASHQVGIDARVKNIDLWLQDGSTEVGVLAIYGMGGIGKTTIAKTAYNQNFDKFDGSSFLANVREASEQPNGLVRLQRQLLSDILKKKVEKVHNVDEGVIKIKNAVNCKRVLLVLDDVDDLDQLNAVTGMRQWFYPGSKIIITTRHERLLKAHEVCEMYKVQELDDKESLQLFSWHAFGQDHPIEGYVELSERVLQHCGRIPLALQVLGSSMSGRNIDVWESAIKKLEAIPDSQILKKLKVSYDSLDDDHDKNLFLDIVCFFIGKDKDYVVRILDECDFFTIVGIQNLIERCLLMIGEDNKMKTHDLIRDMGREIVRQESPEEPGQRSRIWNHNDSLSVLSEKTGTETVKGLVLDMQMFMEGQSVGQIFSSESNDAKRKRTQEFLDELLLIDQGRSLKRRRLDLSRHSIDALSKIANEAGLKTDAIARMHELRLLLLHYVKLTGCYKEFPKKLKLVYWRGFPLKSIPNDFPLESLVALEMRNSSLKQVWSGTKVLKLLRFLNLSHSHSLTKTPDFSRLPKLERLILKDCIRLVEVHESIGELERLVFLNLRDCTNLRKLPKSICQLNSLEKLILSGCSNLIELPIELGKLESLTVLHADKVAVNQLVPTTGEVKSWKARFWSWVSKRSRSPESIGFFLATLSHSLVKLSLANCNLSNDAIPIDLNSLSLLQYLNLSENPINTLPESIKGLCMLRDLWVDSCTGLQSLPELPSSLVTLKAVHCTSLKRITNLPNLLKSLFLDVSECNNLVEVQGLFKLAPIGDFFPEMINDLGLFNTELIGNKEVELFNNMTKTRIRCTVQGLYEFGIFSSSLPGNEIPDRFSQRAKGNFISFNVPSEPNLKMRGFSICFVYSRSKDRTFRFWGESSSRNWYSYFIKISNKTRGQKWIYSPTFLGIPSAGEDMTCLSHWKFENQLADGDEVSVSVVGLSVTFRIKECGISFVYEEQKQQKGTPTKSEEEVEEEQVIKPVDARPFQNTIDGLLSAYQLRSGEYFLSHPEYFILAEGSNNSDAVRSVLYENLFQDNVQCTGSTYEGGEEVDDESEDYFDDDTYDDVDEEELMTILGWKIFSSQTPLPIPLFPSPALIQELQMGDEDYLPRKRLHQHSHMPYKLKLLVLAIISNLLTTTYILSDGPSSFNLHPISKYTQHLSIPLRWKPSSALLRELNATHRQVTATHRLLTATFRQLTANQRQLKATHRKLTASRSQIDELTKQLKLNNFIVGALVKDLRRLKNPTSANQIINDPSILNYINGLPNETKLAIGPHKLPLGHSSQMGSDQLYLPIGGACLEYKDELTQYMTYTVGGECPVDDVFAQRLMLKGCEPLPRRRCHPKAPAGYINPTPLPGSLWATPPDTSIVWDPYTCKNYQCLIDREKTQGFSDCKDCFDLQEREKSRWLFDGGLDYGIDQVLSTKPHGTIRIGLDIGGGSGTFAARMKERDVTIITISMNFDGPSNSFISSRGLLSMHLSISQRLPFFENTLDIVHSMHVLSNWIPDAMLEFTLYDIYRVLRPGGLLWLDHFFCLGHQLNATYIPMLDGVGFKRLRWNVGLKLDPRVDENEWYFSALLEKPMS